MKQSTVLGLGDRVLRGSLATAMLLVGSIVGVLVLPGATVSAAAALTPVNPARFVDTRVGEQTVDGKFAGTGRIAAGTEFAITIAGRPGVPKDAAAVMMNVTAVRPNGPGHVTVYPCGSKEPNVSNINYAGGDVAPNAVLSKIGTKGQVCVVSLRGTDLIVDVNAFVPAGGTPVSINPVRNVDTRDAAKLGSTDNPGRLAAGKEYKFTIAGKTGVPPKAVAAMMNITAVRPDGPGFVTVYPCGTKRPIVSNINYAGGDVAPNAVLSKIGTKGQICVYSLRGTDLIIDVNAYVPSGGAPTPVNPVRYADTRAGESTIDGKDQGSGRLKGGTEHRFTIAGRPGVPKNAAAAMMNITAVRPSAPGHVTVYPCGTKRPIVSSINYRGGDVAPNAVLSKLGTGGQICIYSLAATDLIIDINGYVAAATEVDPPPPPPPPTPPACVINGITVGTVVTGPECDALVDLYNSTNGPKWKTRTGWNTPTDPCNWYGIKCVNGKLIWLVMEANDLAGPLPASIGKLTNLSYWGLGENALTGEIPSEIGDLKNLLFLSLYQNRLTGTIPASVTSLTGLSLLDFGNNQLSGPIPSRLGNLTNLEILDLSRNQLSGRIPDSFAGLKKLNYANLFDNQLSGRLPADLGSLGALDTLDISGNQLTGPIPGSIGNLKQLTELNLSNNKLTRIPNTIGGLRSLVYLQLQNNQLAGSIPTGIGDLAELETLHLYNNQLTGGIPGTIGRARQLVSLNLANNALTGKIPLAVRDLANLREINLNNNQLTGPIRSRLGDLPALTRLNLANNQLSGRIPKSLGNLSGLTELRLNNNQLEGPLPPELMNTTPETLRLRNNGCLTAATTALEQWLDNYDSKWDNGCD